MAGRYPSQADFAGLIDGLRPAAEEGPLTADEVRAALPGLGAGKLRVMPTVLKQAGLIRGRLFG